MLSDVYFLCATADVRNAFSELHKVTYSFHLALPRWPLDWQFFYLCFPVRCLCPLYGIECILVQASRHCFRQDCIKNQKLQRHGKAGSSRYVSNVLSWATPDWTILQKEALVLSPTVWSNISMKGCGTGIITELALPFLSYNVSSSNIKCAITSTSNNN